MSRPVYILNNNKKVRQIKQKDSYVFFGNDYHFQNETNYREPNYSSANFGDILLCELSNEHLSISSTYDVSVHPVDKFEPIAVCIYDTASHRDGLSIWLSVKWCDKNHAGQGTVNSSKGIQDISWGHGNYNTSNSENTLVQNNRIKEIDNTNWQQKTSWEVSEYQTYWPAFELAWRYKTPGTKEGDWYLPSYYDVIKGKNNASQLTNIFTNIKTQSNNLYLDTISNWSYLSSSNGNAGGWSQFANIYMSYPAKAGKVPVRAVLVKQ